MVASAWPSRRRVASSWSDYEKRSAASASFCDLGGAATGERVLEGGAGEDSLQEADPHAAGGAGRRLARVAVALRVDDDRALARPHVGLKDRRLGDGLAGPGGAADQGVHTAIGAEGDAADAALAGGAGARRPLPPPLAGSAERELRSGRG